MILSYLATVLLAGLPGFAMALDTSSEARIEKLISELTLQEKINMVSGTGVETHAVPRLHIPSLKMTDGPSGSRWEPSTAFPSGVLLGATFNPDLIRQVGAGIGRETKSEGRDMLLGPTMNIARMPMNGRQFESFGEDPYLTSQMAASYVTGVQSEKVVATAKHFALNDQEFERKTLDVHADERTMNEIYLPPFKASVDAGVWAVMAAYNKVNGLYSTENAPLLDETLKKKWNYQGLVVSDWVSTHSTQGTANAGLDIDMPSGEFFGPKLLTAVKNKTVSVETVNDKVRRILRAMIAEGILDLKEADRPPRSIVSGPEHRRLALKAAEEGLVLLKNENEILPLAPALKKIAVIGPNADILRVLGGGSAETIPLLATSPLHALKQRLQKSSTEVVYSPGPLAPEDFPLLDSGVLHQLKGEYFANATLSGTPVLSQSELKINGNWDDAPDDGLTGAYSVRWTAQLVPKQTGEFDIAFSTDQHFRIYLNGRLVLQRKADDDPALLHVSLKAGVAVPLRIEFFNPKADSTTVRLGWLASVKDPVGDAATVARNSDVAVIFAGLNDRLEAEGLDRDSMELPEDQVRLIEAVAAANPRTIVVLNSGNPVVMESWLPKVQGVIQAWYPGQEGGYAIADVLLGLVNPSGKLPLTYPKSWADSSAAQSYPGKNGELTYTEGIYVGYRHFDTHLVEPRFPFGYGLSYTQFKYSNLKMTQTSTSVTKPQIVVEFDLTNVGQRAGAEAAQLYVAAHTPEIDRPVQELKGIAKRDLLAGETAHIRLVLDAAAFSYYDVQIHDWTVLAGRYDIRIGGSSRDIRLNQAIQLK